MRQDFWIRSLSLSRFAPRACEGPVLMVETKREADVLVAFFGVLDRGLVKTHATLNDFVRGLKQNYSVTVACFDVALHAVDGMPRCFEARERLNCDVYVAHSERRLRQTLARTPTIVFDRPYYTAQKDANAMVQLYSEQMVSDFLRREGARYSHVIASGADLLFMNAFDASLVRGTPLRKTVQTSVQQNGHQGYTNAFYVGEPRSVMHVMNRLHDAPNITRHVHDYEFMLRSAFEFHRIQHRPIQPWFFMKVRANCEVVWPVGYFSRVGRNPNTSKYASVFRQTVSSMKRKTDCTCGWTV